MDVQKFGTPVQNMMDGLLGELPGQAKKKKDQGEFQMLLGQLGLSAAMLNNQQMPSAMLDETETAEVMTALSGPWNEPGEMDLGKHQMEKLLFLNYQNQGEDPMGNLTDSAQTQFDLQMAVSDGLQNKAASDLADSPSEMPGEGLNDQKLFSTQANKGDLLESAASEVKNGQEHASVHAGIGTAQSTGNQKSQETVSTEESFLTEKTGISHANSLLSRERLIKKQPEEDGQESVLTSDVGQNPQVRNGQGEANISEVPSYATVTVKDEVELPDMLGKILQKTVSAGRTELEIQLEPEHLGKISIKVMTEDSQTVISLCCSEEKTRYLLAQNARELGAIMENNLGTAPQILVEKQAADYLQRENHQGGQQQQEQQERRQQKQPEREADDFLQKLRIRMMGAF